MTKWSLRSCDSKRYIIPRPLACNKYLFEEKNLSLSEYLEMRSLQLAAYVVYCYYCCMYVHMYILIIIIIVLKVESAINLHIGLSDIVSIL